MTKSPRIIFMGTPQFAVPSLDILVRHGYEVVAVVTATDKYGGRGGKQLLESAVKKYAVAAGIPVLQPRNLKSPEFLAELAAYRADLQIIVAFRMLPEAVWSMPSMGTFNLHASLLPRYRGAAPINWAIIRGEKETGVTTFFLQHAIDTGNIIMQEKLPIGPDETAGQVHDRLMLLGAEVVLKTVELINAGKVDPQPQNHELATSAPKLKPENTRIDFTRTAREVHNFVRGLSPYPGAWTTLKDKKWKILRSLPHTGAHDLTPGTVVTEGKEDFRIAVADGYIEVLELQLPGKRRMNIRDFLNGHRTLVQSELVFT
ncbi:MAG: methionyl-tRNA formyltransferase [Bacteroidetes bacterium]|nr:MAG: methionyl-tRNA formyltransferase [Bacteroidota bacterium]